MKTTGDPRSIGTGSTPPARTSLLVDKELEGYERKEAGAMLFLRWRTKTRRAGEPVARVAQEAERGRRLAIYDESSVLLARWYFELRLHEGR